MRIFIISILTILFSINSFALTPEDRLDDIKQEERARNLFLEVRCLVCDGQVIESSNTEFSFEMRQLIRQKIVEGKSDQKIKQELIKEFGEDILTNQDIRSKNGLLLWCLPIAFAVGLVLLGIKLFRN